MAIKPKTLYKLTSTSEELTSENYLTTTEEIDLTKYKSFEGVNRGGSNLLALCHFDDEFSKYLVADGVSGYWYLNAPSSTVTPYDTTNKKFGKGCINLSVVEPMSKSIDGFNPAGEFTLSFWMKQSSITAGDTSGRIVAIGTSLAGGNTSGIWFGSTSLGAGSSVKTITSSDTGYFTSGEYVHYEISKSSNNVFFFVNGVLKDTIVQTDINVSTGYEKYIAIGNAKVDYIDELKVYNYCKHTTDFTPETSTEYIGKTAYLKDNKLYGIDSTDAMVVLSADYASETDIPTLLNKVTRDAYKSELTTLSTFSIINYSTDKEATYAIQAIPKPLLLTPKALNDDSLVNTYGTWSTTYTVSGSGVIKYALTNDLSTYFIYSGNTWPTVDATTADKALSSFESIQTLAAYQMQKAKFSTGKSAIAFVLDITYLSDVATIDTVKDNETVKEHWVDTNEFSSSYVNNNELDLTITGTGNYLVDWNKNEDIDIDSNGGLATEDDILNMFNEE